ncbi:uncharacterized protein PFL1_00251 [Pseudozyma flocculosa PF-1]|uniref:Probable Alpha-glucosidase n=2 Tax=Pseudozyma flocculosa TaxID=84751 RepID=A0A5C3EV64_9BASI|nr:uncharacterized protein PFL1_00251 [Pseudozyma flocculosa PF-1]EPQ32053.1 hypothetical protein PFL1_00251 [Pseudozyma flocculosa PF-1]SPO35019.1 probable Alpha-glucosidase precursor [Pseudozyma flocculosa]
MRPALSPLYALAVAALTGSTLSAPATLSTRDSQLELSTLQQRQASNDTSGDSLIRPSFDVTACPGYQLVGEPKKSRAGFTARLSLAGEACHAYGVDIQNLTLAVVYENKHQLHVHLYDTDKQQYQLPDGLIFDRPGDDPAKIKHSSTVDDSDLVFHHTGESGNSTGPWAFWVERRSNGDVIFDTRPDNIPTYDQGINNVSGDSKRNSTAMPAHPLVFENQYLQLSSALPEDANIYGLGEYVGSFRRDPDETLQPFFTLDAGTPVDSNQYGYHPVYTEARQGADGKVNTHAVYLQNTAGMDVLLRRGLIQYRAIGGTLDFRFFSGDDAERGGNSANAAIAQYVNFVGLPTMQPYWSFGMHLLRWGYNNVSQTREVNEAMRKADIPLEVQWQDIDYMDTFRDFTVDPNRFPQEELAGFISDLRSQHQHYVPIIDAAIPKAPTNESDTYAAGTRGDELDVFLNNRNGTQYVGSVWPGYTTFVDQQAPNAQQWWTEAMANFSKIVDFSGIWLDMNEPSSFIIGNAAGPETNLSSTPVYTAQTSQPGWPQGYDNMTWGNSGNITVNGTYTFKPDVLQNNPAEKRRLAADLDLALAKRQDAGGEDKYGPNEPDFAYANASQRYRTNPPYAIHNGIHYSEGPLNINLDHKTVSMDAVGVDGERSFYDVHNLDGTLEEMHVHRALKKIHPDQRPFLISRSTYPGAGKYTGHWLGDNFSIWKILPGKEAYKAGAGMAESIGGMLQFQIFGMPMVGADICGFNRNTDEELCNRWMMLGAWSPFMRNHNTQGAISQEPYRWDSVAEASRRALRKRYELLPTLYSHVSRSSVTGQPALRALWYEFESVFEQTKDSAHQFLFGPDLLVTPVLEPNVTTVKGLFPSAGGSWRNVYTYEALDVEADKNVTVEAPLSHINAHLRPGRALLTHAEPSYTTYETRQKPFGLVVNLNSTGQAYSDFYLDDGETPAPTDNSTLVVEAAKSSVSGRLEGAFRVKQPLERVIVLDVAQKPNRVSFGGKDVSSFKWNGDKKMLNVTGLSGDLNGEWKLRWE